MENNEINSNSEIYTFATSNAGCSTHDNRKLTNSSDFPVRESVEVNPQSVISSEDEINTPVEENVKCRTSEQSQEKLLYPIFKLRKNHSDSPKILKSSRKRPGLFSNMKAKKPSSAKLSHGKGIKSNSILNYLSSNPVMRPKFDQIDHDKSDPTDKVPSIPQ